MRVHLLLSLFLSFSLISCGQNIDEPIKAQKVIANPHRDALINGIENKDHPGIGYIRLKPSTTLKSLASTFGSLNHTQIDLESLEDLNQLPDVNIPKELGHFLQRFSNATVVSKKTIVTTSSSIFLFVASEDYRTWFDMELVLPNFRDSSGNISEKIIPIERKMFVHPEKDLVTLFLKDALPTTYKMGTKSYPLFFEVGETMNLQGMFQNVLDEAGNLIGRIMKKEGESTADPSDLMGQTQFMMFGTTKPNSCASEAGCAFDKKVYSAPIGGAWGMFNVSHFILDVPTLPQAIAEITKKNGDHPTWELGDQGSPLLGPGRKLHGVLMAGMRYGNVFSRITDTDVQAWLKERIGREDKLDQTYADENQRPPVFVAINDILNAAGALGVLKFAGGLLGPGGSLGNVTVGIQVVGCATNPQGCDVSEVTSAVVDQLEAQGYDTSDMSPQEVLDAAEDVLGVPLDTIEETCSQMVGQDCNIEATALSQLPASIDLQCGEEVMSGSTVSPECQEKLDESGVSASQIKQCTDCMQAHFNDIIAGKSVCVTECQSVMEGQTLVPHQAVISDNPADSVITADIPESEAVEMVDPKDKEIAESTETSATTLVAERLAEQSQQFVNMDDLDECVISGTGSCDQVFESMLSTQRTLTTVSSPQELRRIEECLNHFGDVEQPCYVVATPMIQIQVTQNETAVIPLSNTASVLPPALIRTIQQDSEAFRKIMQNVDLTKPEIDRTKHH